MNASKAPPRTDKLASIIYTLFFLSGFPALFYQVTWQRALYKIFGVNSESTTIIVTAFLLGLGLGNLAGGWFSRFKNLHLLVVVAIIETLIGLFGFASLSIFESTGQAVLGLPLIGVAPIILGLILVPTILMGATLPILVAHFAPRLNNTGAAVGSLYYVNTLGAGAACLVIVAVLFPFGGMTITVYTGAAINLMIGLSALISYSLFRKGKLSLEPEQIPAASPSGTPQPLLGFSWVLFLAALEGFISLSYEIFFFRILSYATASNPMVFPITLGIFLIGLASGAGEASRASRKLSHQGLIQKIQRSLVPAILIGIIFLPLLCASSGLGESLNSAPASDASKAGVVQHYFPLLVVIALPLIFFIARLWGLVLPCLTELSIAANHESGQRASWVYASNIAGSVLGATLTGFFLTNWFDLPSLSAILAILGIAFYIVFGTLTGTATHPTSRFVTIGGILLAVMLPSLEHILSPNDLERLQNLTSGQHHFIDAVENRHGIITVDTDQIVYGNGAYDGHFNSDLIHDNNGIIRPFALSLFHNAPHDVLMIGLASGSWARVIADHPDVKHLTIVEINPGYLQLIQKRPHAETLFNNPKVDIVIDDGRRWLNHHPDRYFDAIINNTTYHFRSNTTNLLSSEFLGIVQQHLHPNGVLFYNTTDSARVQRTGCQAFAHGLRFANHMLVSNDPIPLNFYHWLTILKAYKVDDRPVIDMEHADDQAFARKLETLRQAIAIMDTPAEPKAGEGYIESCHAILDRTHDLQPVTDDNMGTEWRYGFFGDH